MPAPTVRPGGIDWGLGDYELTAAELEPAAEHVVALAALSPGDRVLDVATGTGNAALAAARAGATVTGVDASARLVERARERAAESGLEASFSVGDLHELPFAAGSFDCVISVFGVIFAADPQRAAAELLRVLAPDGRCLISIWVPAGPIDAMVGVFMRAVAEATGSRPNRFAWIEKDAIDGLFGPYGVELRWHEGAVQITAGSPEKYLERQRSHPMSVAIAPLLERAGSTTAVYEQALEALRAGNEREDGFLATSPYRVLEIRRTAG